MTVDLNYTELVLRNLQTLRGDREVDEIIELDDGGADAMTLNLQSEEQMLHSLAARRSARVYWKCATQYGGISATGYERFESCATMAAPDTNDAFDACGGGRELQCLSTIKGVAQSNRLINNYKQQKFEHRYDDERSASRRPALDDEFLSPLTDFAETEASSPVSSSTASADEPGSGHGQCPSLSSTALTLKMERRGRLRTIVKDPCGSEDTTSNAVGRSFSNPSRFQARIR